MPSLPPAGAPNMPAYATVTENCHTVQFFFFPLETLDLIIKLSGCLQAPLAVQYSFQERLEIEFENHESRHPAKLLFLVMNGTSHPHAHIHMCRYTVYYGYYVTWHCRNLIAPLGKTAQNAERTTTPIVELKLLYLFDIL